MERNHSFVQTVHDHMPLGIQKVSTYVFRVRPWDARFLGNGKTRVAQNSCNLIELLNKAKARTSKKRAA